MPINNPAAYTFQPFNAAQTLALGQDIQGARTQNALSNLQLQREQDPGSAVNRMREFQANAALEQFQAAQLQNAAPQLSALQSAIRDVRTTMENKGVSAAKQRANERISFLKSSGVLPEDFEFETDLTSLSDEEFALEIAQAEQDVSSTLAALPTDERAAPAALREMTALGYPMTREGFQQYNEDRGSGTQEGLESLIAEARLRGILMEQERSQTEAEREAEERQSERTAAKQQVVRNLEQNRTAVDLTQRLEGTMLESGSFLPSDLRRGLADLQGFVMGLAGQDTSEISNMIADFDTQRKILQDQVNSRISSGDYGRSATQLQSIQRSLASPDISPAAIIRIQGQLAQIDLDRADAEGLEVDNREQWEQRANEWKNYDPLSASIPRMSLSQLRQLDIDSLSDEQAEAALKRFDELSNGR